MQGTETSFRHGESFWEAGLARGWGLRLEADSSRDKSTGFGCKFLAWGDGL